MTTINKDLTIQSEHKIGQQIDSILANKSWINKQIKADEYNVKKINVGNQQWTIYEYFDRTFIVMSKQMCYACGRNDQGQLGIGFKSKEELKPVKVQLVLEEEDEIEDIFSGTGGTFFKTKRTIQTCGDNSYGQLGLSEKNIVTPTKLNITNPSEVSYIHVGTISTFIVKNNSVLVCGKNESGNLGIGSRSRVKEIAQMKIDLHDENIHKIYTSWNSTFVVTNHSIYVCGLNDFGQLGVDKDDQFITSPEKMLITPQDEVKMIKCSWFVTYILTSEAIFSIGRNDYGLLGIKGKIQHYKPIKMDLNPLIVAKIKDIVITYTSSYLIGEKFIYSLGGNDTGILGVESMESTIYVPTRIKLNLSTQEIIKDITIRSCTTFINTTKSTYVCGEYDFENNF